MFKLNREDKNYLKCNDLITKGMIKRRRLAASAILNLCEFQAKIYVVK